MTVTDYSMPHPNRKQDYVRLAAGLALAGGLVLILAIVGSLSMLQAVLAFAGTGGLVMWGQAQQKQVRIIKGEVTTPEPAFPTGQALLDALRDPAVLVGSREEVIGFNAAASKLLPGLARGEAFVRAVRMPALLEAVRRCSTSGGQQVIAFAERVPIERWFRADVSALEQDKGASRDVLVTIHEETQEKRAELMRADFVANVSHELRTPLASVLGFIETLNGPAKNDPAARERFLSIMMAQARRMARLIDDLLSLSRIENREHIHPQDKIDLGLLLAHLRDTLLPLANEQGIAIDMEGEMQGLIILGDRDELIRLFENLIQNAMRYGSEGKRVLVSTEIKARGKGREVAVCVRDFGAGIPREHLPRLTERFYRADPAQSREKGGTGLGLAIVKHTANRHRARLTITSDPGQGAAFKVTFDLAQ